MANTLNLGTGNWATKESSLLGYNSENGNFKPLPFDFSRASSATVVNKAGLIETVGSGEPRIDYLNDSKGALLLEPTRSNVNTYSEDVSFWTKSNVVTTSDYAISPDGTQNAFRAVFSSSTGLLYISALGTTGTNNTLSVWAKSNNGSSNKFRFFANGNTTLSNDFIATDEWQRFEFTFNCTAVTSGLTGASDSATNDILFYGFQHEVGSYATSYIPTSGSAVTRVAEVCSQTVPDGILGANEVSFVIDFEINGDSPSFSNIFNTNKNTTSSFGVTRKDSNGLLEPFLFDSGVNVGTMTSTTSFLNGVRGKFAVGYKSGDSVLVVQGNVEDTNSGTFSNINVDEIHLNDLVAFFGYNSNVKINDFKLYNTRLSNAELQALTS